ncbi:MAG: CBS domain-containing protein [Anaerolineales bacterium]|nr:CBS domain-containing protein [Anaerolineales bacterium]
MITTRVRDLMRSNLISCPPSTTLGEAASMLARHRVHALIVADATGLPLGMLSDLDLLGGDWISNSARLSAVRAMTAGQVMQSPVAAIDASAPASEAAARLRAEGIHRLVVTDMDRPVGVISVADLVRGLAPRHGERRTVADAMARGYLTCRDETTIAAAARAMSDRRSRSIVVVSARGQPLGMVTGFDLLGCAQAGDTATLVSQVIHPPLTIGPAASLREAADLMLRHREHRLLVVDPAEPDSAPLGVLSTADLILDLALPNLARHAT